VSIYLIVEQLSFPELRGGKDENGSPPLAWGTFAEWIT
jgi:hypothetical protein